MEGVFQAVVVVVIAAIVYMTARRKSTADDQPPPEHFAALLDARFDELDDDDDDDDGEGREAPDPDCPPGLPPPATWPSRPVLVRWTPHASTDLSVWAVTSSARHPWSARTPKVRPQRARDRPGANNHRSR